MSARGGDRDREGNCPAYRRAECLLAYEMLSLINGLEGSLGFRKRRVLMWPTIGHWMPLSLAFQVFFEELPAGDLHIRKTRAPCAMCVGACYKPGMKRMIFFLLVYSHKIDKYVKL